MRHNIALAIAAALIVAFFARWTLAADLPDQDKTPGVTRDVTVKQLCPIAHTAKVRNVTYAMKKQAYALYGLKANHTGYCKGKEGCEVDHLISLELGGANDVKNLWPQSYDAKPWNAHVKDKLENWLHAAVCQGTITLDAAQREISTDWIAAYKLHIGEP